MPINCSKFQLNQKLYFIGGWVTLGGPDFRFVSEFYSMNQKGRKVELPPMMYEWNSMSLSGISEMLVALGGWNRGTLNYSEIYMVNTQKWKRLPPLNTARQLPGSIILKSVRAFCFCGIKTSRDHLRSIESLELSI